MDDGVRLRDQTHCDGASSRIGVSAFVRALAKKDVMAVSPPPCIAVPSDWHCEAMRNCRVIVGWIPDWSPTMNAGKFVVRVDALTR